MLVYQRVPRRSLFHFPPDGMEDMKCLADHTMVKNSSWVCLPNVSTHFHDSEQNLEQQIGVMIQFSSKLSHFAMFAWTKEVSFCTLGNQLLFPFMFSEQTSQYVANISKWKLHENTLYTDLDDLYYQWNYPFMDIFSRNVDRLTVEICWNGKSSIVCDLVYIYITIRYIYITTYIVLCIWLKSYVTTCI